MHKVILISLTSILILAAACAQAEKNELKPITHPYIEGFYNQGETLYGMYKHHKFFNNFIIVGTPDGKYYIRERYTNGEVEENQLFREENYTNRFRKDSLRINPSYELREDGLHILWNNTTDKIYPKLESMKLEPKGRPKNPYMGNIQPVNGKPNITEYTEKLGKWRNNTDDYYFYQIVKTAKGEYIKQSMFYDLSAREEIMHLERENGETRYYSPNPRLYYYVIKKDGLYMYKNTGEFMEAFKNY